MPNGAVPKGSSKDRSNEQTRKTLVWTQQFHEEKWKQLKYKMVHFVICNKWINKQKKQKQMSFLAWRS